MSGSDSSNSNNSNSHQKKKNNRRLFNSIETLNGLSAQVGNAAHRCCQTYMETVLNYTRLCKKCKKGMIEVWVRYIPKGPIHREQECTGCGRTIKDPKFREWWDQQFSSRNRRRGGYHHGRPTER